VLDLFGYCLGFIINHLQRYTPFKFLYIRTRQSFSPVQEKPQPYLSPQYSLNIRGILRRIRGLGWNFDAWKPSTPNDSGQVTQRVSSFPSLTWPEPGRITPRSITRADLSFRGREYCVELYGLHVYIFVLIQITKSRGRLYKRLETSNCPTKDETWIRQLY
jgi:hypothetical protein